MISTTSKNNTNHILYLSFNQDYTCISIGTDEGYLIYNVEPLKEIIKRSNFKII